jgi:nitroimidazol reductase NimA-like FMN-containing flavoprotein (pyridoxamine 5'-phosphate oxidase superfamily)
MRTPRTDLDARYGSEGATPTPWAEARDHLATAKVYWISTVRPDGRPHVTPMAAIWLDDALHFTTGEHERKALNLAANPRCVVTTGTNELDGLDVVVEGEAVRVTDEARLRRLAEAYVTKYDQLFVFEVVDGGFRTDGAEDLGLAFELLPAKAFGFGKGDQFSQTRYRFGD